METNIYDNDTFERAWSKLHPTLLSFTRHLVYSWRIPVWHGQEDDIVDDIIQETARRIIERIRKASRGEAAPIQVFEPMVIVTARNYCRDLLRRDMRLMHFTHDDCSYELYDAHNDLYRELDEEAIEHVYIEQLFGLLVIEIARFPERQRRALLTDLAYRMSFDVEPTPLQRAFLNAGISLLEYYQPLPPSAIERSRAVALLYHAYKRVEHLSSVQEYIEVA
jgi:hypothetical protein